MFPQYLILLYTVIYVSFNPSRIRPVQVRHDSLADVTASLLKNADDFERSSGVPARMDDDGAAELGLGVGGGLQNLLLTVRDGPAGADLSDHTTADVRAVGTLEHLADDDV